MGKGKNRIRNTVKPEHVIVSNITPDNSYKSKNVVFDFSSATSFRSTSYGDFNNCLKNANDYIEQFRILMKNIGKLSDYTLSALVNGNHRHCHKIEEDKDKLARLIIKKLFSDDKTYEQEIDAEELFQLGCQDGVRVIGIIRGNIFRVYFIDYFHDLYPDGRHNIRNERNYKFCPMLGELS